MSTSCSVMESAQASIQKVMNPVSSDGGILFRFTRQKLDKVRQLGAWSHFFRSSLPSINRVLFRYFDDGPEWL